MEVKRNYSLDLLKIVSMFFVIILHYNNGNMGGLLDNVQTGTSNYFIAHFMTTFNLYIHLHIFLLEHHNLPCLYGLLQVHNNI